MKIKFRLPFIKKENDFDDFENLNLKRNVCSKETLAFRSEKNDRIFKKKLQSHYWVSIM
jgi:hypothetical protein